MKLSDLIPTNILSGNTDKTDAIALLNADHDKVKALFDRFEEIKDGRANKEKQQIVAEACRELTVHTKVEEEIFYPAVRAAIADDDLMNEATVEHDGAKALIRELETMDASDEMLNAKFTVLGEYVKHHIKEEQDEMFPKVRRTDIDLKALGARMTERKQQMGNGNHASGSGSPLFRKRKSRAKRSGSRSAR